MEMSEITIGGQMFVSIMFGALGATGAWFALKGSVNLLKQRITTSEANLKLMHGRVTRLQEEVKENREKSEHSYVKFTNDLHEVEKTILKAINELKK